MTESGTYEQSAVVRRLRQGDESALREIYDAFAGQLYAYALRVVKDRALAEEVVQDTFIRAWEHRQSLVDEGSLRSYLFTINRNLSVNVLKKLAREDALGAAYAAFQAEWATASDEEQLREERHVLLDRAIRQLPAQRRRVFRMAKLEGASYTRISGELGIARSTINDHITKAQKSIREYVRASGEPLLTTLFCLWSLLH